MSAGSPASSLSHKLLTVRISVDADVHTGLLPFIVQVIPV
jgi:hypothetical protein